jgi:hypothetical protein
MRSSTVEYMLLIIGSQDADPVTDEADQGLMEAFMAYHKAVLDALAATPKGARPSATSSRLGR